MPAQSAARRRWFVTILFAMVVVAVVGGIALSRLREAQAGPVPHTSAASSSAASSSAPVSASAEASEPVTSESSESAAPARTKTHTSTTKPTTAAPSGPSIVYFDVATKPSCPSGTDKVKYEGQPVTLNWKVTGADKTTISVDGPGLYDTYGTKDSVTIEFPCSGDPGSYQSHTYKLSAIGPDGTKTKTVTVRAKVNEIATT